MTLYIVIKYSGYVYDTVYDVVPASFLDYYGLSRVVAQGSYRSMYAARRLMSSRS